MRQYNFPLPYEIHTFYVSTGIDRLKELGLFDKLPEPLQQRFQYASEHWLPVVMTKEDCDSIDLITWGAIAHIIGLDWQTM